MKKFKNVYVEITTSCNLKCEFCPSKQNMRKEFLEFDKFKHIIDEIKDFTDGIYLHILGEPFLHQELFSFIDYASKYVKVSLTTNGHLLKNYYRDLCKSNLYLLNISLQSIANLSELDNYFENLNQLIINRKAKLPIHLRIWNDKHDENTRLLNKKLYELIDHYHFLDYPLVTISEADEFEWPSLNNEYNLMQTSCLGAKTQMGILLNGDVTICCLDYLGKTKLGNIYHDSFLDIIKSDKFKMVLKGWNETKPYFELCQKCTFRNRFKKEKKDEG